jgi:hypothetical protein
MNDEALIAELERHREVAVRWSKSQDAVPPGSDISEVAPIFLALLAHPAFREGRQVFFAHKELGIYPYAMTRALLQRMLRSDAASAVAWLHRLLEIDRTSLRVIAVVYGLEVAHPVSLSNGVCLLPLADGPDSENFRTHTRRYQAGVFPMEVPTVLAPPAIAVFDMGVVNVSTSPDSAASDSAYDALLDAARAFTLTDGCAPVVGISWTDFIDPELALFETFRQWIHPLFEGSLVESRRLKVDTVALAWAERYLKMDRRWRPLIAVALDRLNLARRRQSHGDQAIDSGICLESLLGDDSPQELTYKLRLRAALLLGKSIEERQKIREDVGRLYDLRSKVVHGRVRVAKHASRDKQVASRGLEICTQAVRAIVQRNAAPDFPMWELTGGPCDPEDG